MKHIHFLIASLLLLCSTSAAMAQDTDDNKDYKPTPYMFVGLQGGIQNTITNVNNWKLINPTASVSFGAFFTPVVGARLHVNGAWNKGGFYIGENAARTMVKYYYNYITTNLDLMLNMVTMFGKKNYYPVNFYLIGGIGLNTAWRNNDANWWKANYGSVLNNTWDGTQLSHNARIGGMLDINLAKHWSVNLEVSANSLSDTYNSKLSNKDDWSITVQAGVAYKFGYKKKPVIEAPKVEEVWATRIDTVWYDVTEYVESTEPANREWVINYALAKSGLDASVGKSPIEQIKEIGDFLKSHKESKISVCSYADKGTGSSRGNLRLSKKRNQAAIDALVAEGVDASLISGDGYGDTVQPFAENDKNRCTIIKATGLQYKKVPKTVKKFRTEEVRYQVQ